MNALAALCVALGAAVGAPARYSVDRWCQARFGPSFPWGTLVVNVVGAFILGLLTASTTDGDADLRALVGIGFCGTLTTFSSFAYATSVMFRERLHRSAALNIGAQLILGLAAVSAGFGVGELLAR